MVVVLAVVVVVVGVVERKQEIRMREPSIDSLKSNNGFLLCLMEIYATIEIF